jgi:hypothetical protein
MVGVVPPLERMEPEPETEVTVPAKVVVAIILPFWSTARTEEVKPLPRESWEIVVVAKVEVAPTFKPLPVLKVNRLLPAVVEAPEAKTIWFAERLPDNLLLKLVQSPLCSWPVFTEDANGRLMVKELVVVEMLNMLPAVPVETLVMTLLDRVIFVLVPIKTLWPPVMESPEPTVKEPSVVVPSPPLVTARGLVRVKLVKLGVAETAMVEVPEITMLEPEVKREPMSE